MMAFRLVWERSVHYWDTPLQSQLHKPNRSWEPGRVMGESPGTRRVLLGAPPAFAGPRNISEAYGELAKSVLLRLAAGEDGAAGDACAVTELGGDNLHTFHRAGHGVVLGGLD